MKRAVALVLAFLVLATVAVINAQSKGTVQPKGKNASVEQKLIDMEKQFWEAWKNKNGDPFRQNLTEQFVIVGEGGVGRGQNTVIDDVTKGDCDVKSYALSDLKVDWLDDDMALLTYRADEDASCGGHKLPATVYAGSLWQKKGSKWLSAFHQETPAAPRSPQQTPAQ
jgi:hypothetical protein